MDNNKNPAAGGIGGNGGVRSLFRKESEFLVIFSGLVDTLNANIEQSACDLQNRSIK